MAFSDPQSVTIDGAPVSLPRTSTTPNSSVYSQPEGELKLSISHQLGKRNRRTIRLDDAKIAPDVFTAVNLRHTMSAYLVVDTPQDGYTIAEEAAVVDALVDYLSANANAAVTKLLGGEN